MGITEDDTFGRHPVEVGRLDLPLFVQVREVSVTQVVGQDEDDIRLFLVTCSHVQGHAGCEA